jgi:hypothetical protein
LKAYATHAEGQLRVTARRQTSSQRFFRCFYQHNKHPLGESNRVKIPGEMQGIRRRTQGKARKAGVIIIARGSPVGRIASSKIAAFSDSNILARYD